MPGLVRVVVHCPLLATTSSIAAGEITVVNDMVTVVTVITDVAEIIVCNVIYRCG